MSGFRSISLWPGFEGHSHWQRQRRRSTADFLESETVPPPGDSRAISDLSLMPVWNRHELPALGSPAVRRTTRHLQRLEDRAQPPRCQSDLDTKPQPDTIRSATINDRQLSAYDLTCRLGVRGTVR